jgi:hypothetical protein
MAGRKLSMNVQKSEVAQLLRQINLMNGAAARGLTGLSAGTAKHSSITARLGQIGAYQQLACVITTSRKYCNKSLSRVQYNIDVVRWTQKLLVTDAV